MLMTIKYVNFPKPGGKYGSIKDAGGNLIWVPGEMLNAFRAGMTVDVPTSTQIWGQGDRAREVIVAVGPQQGRAQQGNMGQQAGSYGQAAMNPLQQDYGNQRSNTRFQPRVIEGGGGQARQEDPSKMIFVTGVCGRAMGSGKFTASEIGVLAQEAARVYDVLTGASPSPYAASQAIATASLMAGNQMLNDPIPDLTGGLQQGDPGANPDDVPY